MNTAVENYSVSPRTKRYLTELLEQNPELERMLIRSTGYEDFCRRASRRLELLIAERPEVQRYLQQELEVRSLSKLSWSDYALIRLHHYLHNEGRVFEDLNVRGGKIANRPLKLLWLAWSEGTGGAKSDFFIDAIELFKQLKSRKRPPLPSRAKIEEWMRRHPSGLDDELVAIRERNKRRIIDTFIRLYEAGKLKRSRHYHLPAAASYEEKYALVEQWWQQPSFHLRFAIRDYKLLDEFLDHSLAKKKMELFKKATRKGLPFFVNLYYLSLINTGKSGHYIGADMPIRDYIFYNEDLIDTFGHISAWEKEDRVEAGKPNAAGWLLPNDHNIHRRYPEVAIFIPDTMGRSCGGLCVSCQRMYDFQKGHLNFNLQKLAPRKSWDERLKDLLKYFEEDAQLRDILITGGDALMSSNRSLQKILDEVLHMARRKQEANARRAPGMKYAPLRRVRLGTRLPVYLPQRIDEELVAILHNFKREGEKLGIRQFVVQTHFVSAVEITPESRQAVRMLQSAGWLVSNQAVFTTSSARRGHLASLRKALNRIGVLPYYTFSVKGYRENRYNFATNARLAQEMAEEKYPGRLSIEEQQALQQASDMPQALKQLCESKGLPFVATDRSVMNLPAVGKSLSFAVIGITYDGRRILRFKHDHRRRHSPKVVMTDDVVVVESKSIRSLIEQLEKKGDRAEEYSSLYGYSLAATEARFGGFDYPAEEERLSSEFTHFQAD